MKRILVACGLMIAAVSPARAESVLRTMITTDIRGLMPGNSPDDNTGTVLQNIYEGLVAWRADGTVAPMLAKDIETSADGRTYTFTLRDGVRFHNGAPLSSREVVWTWERFLDPKSGWPCRANFDGTRQIKISRRRGAVAGASRVSAGRAERGVSQHDGARRLRWNRHCASRFPRP